MPELVTPTVRVHQSFLAAMEEFRAEGRAGDHSMIGRELLEFGPTWTEPAGFARYVAAVVADAQTPMFPGFVPQTTLWYVDGDDYLGRVGIRHHLTPHLLEEGGHIGYDVRKSARRRGYATEILRQALSVAATLGIESALVTCDVDNVASRKVIERNGGVLEDERRGKLRFWVPTAKPAAGS
ncbi:GNAT family N-acetyltransferase [Fodinicola acaciae]|uniref:GNAT family N-acetyltransferase n=1 Tax=Fodinicola acaciae TaxID=2681555 RepID=UPI0013D1B2B8|nr:GNAT family N-acetyltransferase [Fodinicola acaciae]